MVLFLFKIISFEQIPFPTVLDILFKHTIYTHTAVWTVVVTQAVWLEEEHANKPLENPLVYTKN